MSYRPDPGGTFASDAHRRVMAHLPNPDDDPISVEDLIVERINRDVHTLDHFENADEVVSVLKDLEADGHARKYKGRTTGDVGHGRQGPPRWRNTPAGFDLLTGPPSETAAAGGSATIGLDPSGLSSNGGT